MNEEPRSQFYRKECEPFTGTPVVGMPATYHIMCDSYPCSVVGVNNDKEIVVIKHGKEVTYTKRKNGEWVQKGSPIHSPGYLRLGYAKNYQSPDF